MPVQPSVGRIVHYVSYGTPGGEFTKECRAAVVTGVSGEDIYTVSLAVLNPTGMFFNQGVTYNATPEPSGVTCEGHLTCSGGTWHYPTHISSNH